MPSRSRVAGANRSVAPQNGGSSRMLNRTATKFVPPMRTTAAKASGIKRLGARSIMPASRFLRLGFQDLVAGLSVIHGPQAVSGGADSERSRRNPAISVRVRFTSTPFSSLRKRISYSGDEQRPADSPKQKWGQEIPLGGGRGRGG